MNDVETYLNQLESEQQRVVRHLYLLIQKWQPGLAIRMWDSMKQDIIGFGQASYRYKSGKEGSWFIVGLSALKNYNSLYIWGFAEEGYLLEQYAQRLGAVKCGKCCLNFKSISDLNLDVLKEVIGIAVEQTRQKQQ